MLAGRWVSLCNETFTISSLNAYRIESRQLNAAEQDFRACGQPQRDVRRPIEQIWLRSQLVKLSLNRWSLELAILKPWLLGLSSLGSRHGR
jgi:hypothetical protein